MIKFIFSTLFALGVLAVSFSAAPLRPQEKAGLTAAGTPADTVKVVGDEKAGASKSSADPQKSTAAKAQATKGDTLKAAAKSKLISPDKGIGPIKEIKLGPIDSSLASKGEEVFQAQCVSCHLLDKKKIGPPLREVVEQRPPEFIMNMMLNTDEMEKKDPEIKKLISEYGTYMSVLDISKEQGRQLLEYLRWVAKHPSSQK